ncbi:MAG TPA: YggT family protein [Anaerolineales bacterium]
MSVGFWIRTVDLIVSLLSIMLVIDILMHYFLSMDQPVRRFLDALFEPMLAPIRRILPPVGMFDFSPVVLLVLFQLIGGLLIQLLAGLG